MKRSDFWKENKEKIEAIVKEINKTGSGDINKYLLDNIDAIAGRSRYEISMSELRRKAKKINVDFTISATENREKIVQDYDPSKAGVINIINQYKLEISRYPLLKPEEEKELFERYNNGEKYLKETIYNSNLRLVANIAGRYTNSGVEYLDLVQEGNIGLLKAIDKFDVTLGYKFSTYATPWIKQSIASSISDIINPYHIPHHMDALLARITKVNEEYHSKFGRRATFEELAKETDTSIEDIRLILGRTEMPVSIYEKMGENEDTELHELLPVNYGLSTETIGMQDSLKEDLLSILDVLSDREKEIIMRRYDMINQSSVSQRIIAQEQNVTKQNIQQLEARALKKLYTAASKKQLQDYLEY